MRDELEQRAKRGSSKAMVIPERAAREAFVSRECAGDELLLKWVRKRLRAVESGHPYSEMLVCSWSTTVPLDGLKRSLPENISI